MIESPASLTRKPEQAHPTKRKRTVIIFDNFGPYHLARLRAAARVCDLKAIQIAGRSAVYAWDSKVPESLSSETLFPSGTSRDLARGELARRMNESLDRFSPEIVFVPGWASKEAFAAISWCLRHAVPAVVMSESTEWDERRIWWKEWVKRQTLKMCAAGLAGGRPHAQYLIKLGMDPEHIFQGYDAVDNEYFARSANEVRSQRSEIRRNHGLPENYFLASARFVEKKNLSNLVLAYAKYREYHELAAYRRAKLSDTHGCAWSSDAWSLVLLGDGPLRPELDRLIFDLNLQAFIHLPGFKQYPELPVYYGCAGAFIHASTTEQWGLVVNEAMASGLPVLVSDRCGCAPDLVQEDVNGFTFDPYDTAQLAQLMLKVSAPDFPLGAFGDASGRIISEWGPRRFAAGLVAASSSEPKPFGILRVISSLAFLKIAGRASQLAPAQKTIELSGKKANRLLIFHFGRRKMLAIPAKSRGLRRAGVRCYIGHTYKRRLYHHLISSTVLFGLPEIFSSCVSANDSAALGIDYERWIALLEMLLGRTSLQAVLAWPAELHRGRVYMNLFDKGLNHCGFVKIAKLREQPLLEAGYNALVQLRTCNVRQFRLPSPIAFGAFDERAFAIQQPLPPNARSPNWGQSRDVSPLTQCLCVGRQRLSGPEIMQLSWWKQYVEQLPADCEQFHRELTSRLNSGAEVGRVHGDFGVSNMAIEGDAIWLFDWEFSHPMGPVLTDVVGYFLSFSVGRATKSPIRCAQEFTKQFLNKTGPEWHLNVMLALVFRRASGLRDAEVYMRHCSWNSAV